MWNDSPHSPLEAKAIQLGEKICKPTEGAIFVGENVKMSSKATGESTFSVLPVATDSRML
jgi:hypothetical protein